MEVLQLNMKANYFTASGFQNVVLLDGYQKPIQTPSGYLTVLRVHNYGSQKIKELDLIYNRGSQQISKKSNNHP
jgi:hypothetical protein